VQIGEVRPSGLGQQVGINRIRLGSRGSSPTIHGARVDRGDRPAYFQQMSNQQTMGCLDDTRHVLFGCRANDLLQKGVQSGHPLWAVIDPQRTDLTALFIKDQDVMVG
jgi:hypothetical protein